MDRRQLQYFKRIYETRNTTKAAKELYLTRQALSSSLKKFELELGFPLFIRTTDGLIPTPESDVLHEYAIAEQRLFDENIALLEEAMARIRGIRSERPVKLGFSFFLAIPEMMRELSEIETPDNGSRLDFVDTKKVLGWEDVADGKFDIALTRYRPPESRPDLAWVRYLTTSAVAVVSDSSPLADRERADFFEDFRGQTCLICCNGLQNELLPHLPAAGMIQGSAPEESSLAMNFVARGSGVFFVPSAVAHHMAKDAQGLKIIPCDNFPVPTNSYLVFKADAPKRVNDAVDALLQISSRFSYALEAMAEDR